MNVTRIDQVDGFVRDNIYQIMQKKYTWITLEPKDTIQEELYGKYIGKFFKTEKMFKKKTKRKLKIKAFNDAIKNWLKSKKKYGLPFSHVNQNIRRRTRKKRNRRRRNIYTPHPCDEDCNVDYCCPNIVALMECGDSCKSPSKCNNQSSQKPFNFNTKIDVCFINKKVGIGLRAKTHFPKGEFLGTVFGECLSKAEMTRRVNNGSSDYIFKIGVANEPIWAIDPKHFGNHLRFMNHSCEPNCEANSWIVEGRYEIMLHTDRAVSKVRTS